MAISMIPEFYQDKPGQLKVTCKLSEGTLTVTKRNGARGLQPDYSFASEISGPSEDDDGIYDGDEVIISGIDSTGRLLVAKRAHTDPQPFGRVVSQPKFDGIAPAVGTYTAGQYEYRQATIFVYGARIVPRTIYVAQSDNISAGQFLKACAQSGFANEFEESATMTSRMILDDITASSSAVTHVKTSVLEGYEVGTSDLS
jgi:hypothetical protein